VIDYFVAHAVTTTEVVSYYTRLRRNAPHLRIGPLTPQLRRYLTRRVLARTDAPRRLPVDWLTLPPRPHSIIDRLRRLFSGQEFNPAGVKSFDEWLKSGDGESRDLSCIDRDWMLRGKDKWE